MSFLTIVLSPIHLLFLIMAAGLLIGKIKIRHISLGIAGVLFAAILVGALINLLIPETNAEIIAHAQSTMKIFSRLGSALFVSAIGLQTGLSMQNHAKGSFLAFIIGALMSLSGVLVMLLISALDKTAGDSSLLGVLCGALTSTPGLSVVCDLIESGSEDAVWGYGCSYLLGVILAVLFAQLSCHNTLDLPTEKGCVANVKSKIYPELILISVAALLGSVLGSIHIPSSHMSLGSTASTLFAGFVAGCLVKRKIRSMQISPEILHTFKILGLALFFAGTGFTTGTQSIGLDVKTVLYGALISLTTIFCGWLLCRILRPHFPLHSGFVIAGGMTSSPAYGAINAKASDLAINHFSFSYFGALISLVTAIQIIGR